MKHVIHPDLLTIDLPRIEQEMNDPAAFAEFNKCLDKAIKEIERDPVNEGTPLKRPPLEHYRKKKFHSKLKPPQKQSADMRLVFRCIWQRMNFFFWVSANGKRIKRMTYTRSSINVHKYSPDSPRCSWDS